ncbi:hypothetical protein FN846DRAFT_351249 [Sphaerosporella brunnea]|uniref:Uncharacterized protein n=1 Tax=Sphaerosporella brunnea TaxID=1250544 RepID=A0A5J5EJ66_9PEZI|nr:hypothetical protein FN846DRAFT_351249 [Sphaerosporella brunnea]
MCLWGRLRRMERLWREEEAPGAAAADRGEDWQLRKTGLRPGGVCGAEVGREVSTHHSVHRQSQAHTRNSWRFERRRWIAEQMEAASNRRAELRTGPRQTERDAMVVMGSVGRGERTGSHAEEMEAGNAGLAVVVAFGRTFGYPKQQAAMRGCVEQKRLLKTTPEKKPHDVGDGDNHDIKLNCWRNQPAPHRVRSCCPHLSMASVPRGNIGIREWLPEKEAKFSLHGTAMEGIELAV